MSVFIDRFSSADHLKGKERTYEAVKTAVLEAGRFSAFEAVETPRAFERLMQDPEIQVVEMGYPWIGVKLRK